jgi:hypothetical protein
LRRTVLYNLELITAKTNAILKSPCKTLGAGKAAKHSPSKTNVLQKVITMFNNINMMVVTEWVGTVILQTHTWEVLGSNLS